MSENFKQDLITFANRMIGVSPRCTNEESTKLFLILPFLAFLGYDDRNPNEVCPEHAADFSEKYRNRVDFAILKDDEPVIAIECKSSGTPLKDERGQLRAYFNAARTVKMGILTDGITYEFYADSDEQNMMDTSAFLVLDLTEIAKGKIEDSAIDGLQSLQKSSFDPENIGAEAKRKRLFQNIIQQIDALSEAPSEQFTRILLQNAGLSHVRAKALSDYQELIRDAFREFINIRILQRLDIPLKDSEKTEKQIITSDVTSPDSSLSVDTKAGPTESELMVFNYVRRRLAFLTKSEITFGEINLVDYHDYQGKFVIYYKRERKGRLLDLYEGSGSKYRFTFPDGTDIITNDLGDIDKSLAGIFSKRLREEGITVTE